MTRRMFFADNSGNSNYKVQSTKYKGYKGYKGSIPGL